MEALFSKPKPFGNTLSCSSSGAEMAGCTSIKEECYLSLACPAESSTSW
jgi:hypothetical protein